MRLRLYPSEIIKYNDKFKFLPKNLTFKVSSPRVLTVHRAEVKNSPVKSVGVTPGQTEKRFLAKNRKSLSQLHLEMPLWKFSEKKKFMRQRHLINLPWKIYSERYALSLYLKVKSPQFVKFYIKFWKGTARRRSSRIVRIFW